MNRILPITHTWRRWLGLTGLVVLVVACGNAVGDAGDVAVLTGPPGASSSPPAVTGSPVVTLSSTPHTATASTTQATPATEPVTASPTATPQHSPKPTATPTRTSSRPTPTPTPRVTRPPSSPTTTAPTSSPPSTPPAPTPSSTPESEPADVNAFFLKDDDGSSGGTLMPVRRTVPRTPAIATAALNELLRGPSDAEIALDPSGQPPFSLIPSDTLLLGSLDITDGIATVDLSREFEAGAGSSVFARRLAQVVYTLTQFRTITGVRFKLDGEPVAASDAAGAPIVGPATREHYLDLLPRIFVDSPAWDATVSRPIIVSGKANVFEAVFQLELSDDDGRVIIRRAVAATAGTGTWGDWREELDVEDVATKRLWIKVWTPSEIDGSPENVRRYPIELPPR